MTEVILNGCGGKMGGYVTDAVAGADDIEIVAGIDCCNKSGKSYPVYSSFDELEQSGNVVIDFSNASALDSVLNYCLRTKTALVACTTGYNEEQKNKIKEVAKEIPVFYSANMSIGVNLMCELAKAAAKVLGDSFDIEIIEAHHNQKVDAPSGTALMLADSINDALDNRMDYEYNRQAKREKRPADEIGIHSIRGGTIVGEHEVIFAGNDEIIKISHSARSKALFANGAVNAAKFINGKVPGIYTMSDMLK